MQGCWGFFELVCIKCSEQCQWGWMLYPQVSHSCSARFPWQIYQTSDVRASKHLNHGNSAKGHGSFCFNGTSESLATCSFLKSHYLLTWSGVRCTVNSENIIPTLLNKSYKQRARRWETPPKLCGTMFLTLHRHSIHIGDCLRRKCCWPASSENFDGCWTTS